MSAILDLSRHAWIKEAGQLRIYGTWVGPNIDESEPCLAIVPSMRRTSHETVRPAVVALSSAYRYDDPRYLLQAAVQFNKGLGFPDTMQDVMKVADAIYDHLDDLVVLPERPSFGSTIGAEVTLTDSEGRSHEFVIKDHK